jgi:hypothetical protein
MPDDRGRLRRRRMAVPERVGRHEKTSAPALNANGRLLRDAQFGVGGSLSVAWDQAGRSAFARCPSRPSTGPAPSLATRENRCTKPFGPCGGTPQPAASRRLIPSRRPGRAPHRNGPRVERALASSLRATRPKPLALGLRRFWTLLRCFALPRGTSALVLPCRRWLPTTPPPTQRNVAPWNSPDQRFMTC